MSVIDQLDANEVFERTGSTWAIDAAYLFIQTPLGVSGVVLNIISFYVLHKIGHRETKMNEYLKFYAENGCVMCTLAALSFISSSPRFFPPLYLNYFAKILRCSLLNFLSSIIFMTTNMLDIILAINRLSMFVKTFKRMLKYEPFTICLLITWFSFMIHLPSFYFTSIKTDLQLYTEITSSKNLVDFCGITKFFYSETGQIILSIQIFIRDILILLFEIIFAFLAVCYYRKFNCKRLRKIQTIGLLNSNPNNKRNKIEVKMKRDELIARHKKMNKCNQLLLMTIWLSCISILSHLAICFGYMTVIQGHSHSMLAAVCFAQISGTFKHFTNFFVFFYFNSNFKKQIQIVI